MVSFSLEVVSKPRFYLVNRFHEIREIHIKFEAEIRWKEQSWLWNDDLLIQKACIKLQGKLTNEVGKEMA